MKKIRGQAFCYLNQLGKKLRNNPKKLRFLLQMKNVENTSLENHKIGSDSSNFSDEIYETDHPKTIIPMSPIKTRKEILNPFLNCEQSNFLNI
jgi:hypothetical protein